MLQHKHLKPSMEASGTALVYEAHSLPLRVPPHFDHGIEIVTGCRWEMWQAAFLDMMGEDRWLRGSRLTLPLLTWVPTFLLPVWLDSNWDMTTSMQHKAQPANKGHKTRKNKSIKCSSKRKQKTECENLITFIHEQNESNIQQHKSGLSGYQNVAVASQWLVINLCLCHNIINIVVKFGFLIQGWHNLLAGTETDRAFQSLEPFTS